MKLVVTGPENAVRILTELSENTEWIITQSSSSFPEHTDADAFFDLNDEADINTETNAPLFLNRVINKRSTKNVIRINGWNGFLEKESWECAGNVSDKSRSVLQHLNKKMVVVNDEPGLVSARILAMIINEAYFALMEDVSTENEIDLAMRLGTNYPKGPFEWSRSIGLEKIYNLLNKLAAEDKRYTPCSLMENQVNKL